MGVQNYDVIDTVQGICNNVIVWDGVSPWTPPTNCITQPSVGTLQPGHVVALQGQTYQKVVAPSPSSPIVVASKGQVVISWTAVPGATSYIVQRTDPSTVAVKTFTTLQTSYTDAAVINETTYTYTVSAIGVNGQGIPTSPFVAKPSAAVI